MKAIVEYRNEHAQNLEIENVTAVDPNIGNCFLVTCSKDGQDQVISQRYYIPTDAVKSLRLIP